MWLQSTRNKRKNKLHWYLNLQRIPSRKQKDNPRNGKKILANQVSDKKLRSGIKSSIMKKNPILKWAKCLSRHFSMEDTEMANKPMKRSSTSSAIRKLKSEPQRERTSHLRAGLRTKTYHDKCWQGRREIGLLTHCWVSWDVKRCSQCGKQSGSPSKV